MTIRSHRKTDTEDMAGFLKRRLARQSCGLRSMCSQCEPDEACRRSALLLALAARLAVADIIERARAIAWIQSCLSNVLIFNPEAVATIAIESTPLSPTYGRTKLLSWILLRKRSRLVRSTESSFRRPSACYRSTSSADRPMGTTSVSTITFGARTR